MYEMLLHIPIGVQMTIGYMSVDIIILYIIDNQKYIINQMYRLYVK